METQVGITITGKPFGVDALAWSEDGVIAACTENSIHLTTPFMVGLSDDKKFKVDNVINELLSEGADHGESTVLKKPMESSYSIPEVYRNISWSPTGLSRTHGCLLTAITSKHRVLLFQPGIHTSNWSLHTDITPMIKRQILQTSDVEGFETTEQIMQFHTLHAAWSPIIIIDPMKLNPALLAVTNQAGTISLWSFSVEHGFEYQTTFKHHSSFVNLCTWSKWRKHDGHYLGYILSTSTDGTVVLTCVKVWYDTNIKSIETNVVYTWFEDDGRIAPVIKLWDESGDSIKILIAKTINIYSANLNVNEDKHLVMDDDWLNYTIPRTALGVSGAYFENGGQYMRLFTYEGDALVLSCQGGTLELADRLSVGMTRKLQGKFKQRWTEDVSKNEEEDLLNNFDMIPQVWGVAGTANGIYSAIMYTIKPVVDMHTYGESRDITSISFMIHPKINGENALQKLLHDTQSYIEDPDFFFTYPVRSILLEQLEFILDEDESDSLMTCLTQLNDLIDKPSDGNTRWKQSTLIRRVYSPTNAIASRIAYYYNMELKNYKLIGDAQECLAEINTKGGSYIVCSFFYSVLSYCNEHDDEFWVSLSADDIFQIILWCDRILYEVLTLPSPDLLEAVKTSHEKLQTHCSSSPLVKNISNEMDLVSAALNGNSVMTVDLQPKQKCPACYDWIPFSLDDICVCSAGHVFDRCSITLQVITSPFYQCCTRCNSKRLPSSENTKNDSTQSMFLSDTVLSQCWKCIYCGSDVETMTI